MICQVAHDLLKAGKVRDYMAHLRACKDCHPLIETPNLDFVYDDELIAQTAAERGVTL